MHAGGDSASIFHSVLACDLGFAIRAHPRADAVLANLGKSGTKRSGKLVGEGHEGFGLICGIAEHDTLVTGSNIFELHGVNRLSNIRTLLLNGYNDIASAVVKTLLDGVISDVSEGVTDDLLVVDVG